MRIALLGAAKTTRHLAPFDDPSWQVWGVNGCWTFAPRADAWFDLHAPWITDWEPLRRPPGHVQWLRAFAGPVYLIEPRADIPTSKAYPLTEMVRRFGRAYLTSSVAMMLALAISRQPDEIGLWGIDLATQSEYADQRPCVEYLLGRAEERGIRITLPEGCPILAGAVYGRGDLNPGGERLSPRQFTDRVAVLAKRQQELTRQAARLDGQIIEAERHGETARLDAHRTALASTLETLARVDGMLAEARYWLAQTPEGASQERVLALTRPQLSVVNGA